MAKIFKPSRGKKASPRKIGGAPVTLQIDSLDHQGRGVCRSHSPVVFVEGALPGETCLVDITQRKARVWEGKVSKVFDAHPQRQAAFCPHVSECGGCQNQHLATESMLAFKQDAVTELLHRVSHIEQVPWQPALTSEARGYRRKARLAVDARNPHKVVLGYRARSSHALVSVSQCEILEPSLQALIVPLQTLLNALQQPRALGHVLLTQGANFVQVCLRVTRTLGQADRALLEDFTAQHHCQLVLEVAPDEFVRIGGPDAPLTYLTGDELEIDIQPNDFVQVNHQINLRMIAQARDWLALSTQDKLVDLFCGVGNFSLPLAGQVSQVTGFEGVANMVQRASDNAQKNGIDNVQFVHTDLNQPDSLKGFLPGGGNKVLLDPAREGAAGVISQLGHPSVEAVLYVSCNPATFARDAASLVEQNLSLTKIGLMDMFPNTAHTELMALFVRHNG